MSVARITVGRRLRSMSRETNPLPHAGHMTNGLSLVSLGGVRKWWVHSSQM